MLAQERMRAIGKILGILFSLILFATGAAIVYALFHFDRKFPAPYPAIRSTSDSAVISRGRYLVYGPGHCADCHAPPHLKARVDSGFEVDMTGGYVINTYLGEIRPPNITSDTATGIGGIGDAELARFMRYGVNHLGQVGLPIMMYADLSDSDLIAILSFLRTLPPVKNNIPASHYNLLGKITKAYFLEPFAPKADSLHSPKPGMTVEYGEYLVNTVSNCGSCHTARNMKTGEYTGPYLAGGMLFHSSNPPGTTVISPNLTPDSATGRITTWTLDLFTKRIKMGNLNTWSPMPWGPFSRMSDRDIGAIYLYLKSLKPVHRENLPPKR